MRYPARNLVVTAAILLAIAATIVVGMWVHESAVAFEAPSSAVYSCADAGSKVVQYHDHVGCFDEKTGLASPAIGGDNLALQGATQRYMLGQLRNTLWSFEWQFMSSIVIFVLVLCLVAFGLWFTFVQFQLATVATQHAANTQKFVAEKLVTTDVQTIKDMVLKLGPGSVEVQTNVLGVVVLIVSLAFFYLYLTTVYPISYAGQMTIPNAQNGQAVTAPLTAGAGGRNAKLAPAPIDSITPAASPTEKMP